MVDKEFERSVFEYEEPTGVGDRIEIIMKEESAYFTVTSDWAGCTETGFGESCSLNIPKDVALELGSALIKWAHN